MSRWNPAKNKTTVRRKEVFKKLFKVQLEGETGQICFYWLFSRDEKPRAMQQYLHTSQVTVPFRATDHSTRNILICGSKNTAVSQSWPSRVCHKLTGAWRIQSNIPDLFGQPGWPKCITGWLFAYRDAKYFSVSLFSTATEKVKLWACNSHCLQGQIPILTPWSCTEQGQTDIVSGAFLFPLTIRDRFYTGSGRGKVAILL